MTPGPPSLLIKNGTVVSGEEGAQPYAADVLIVDGVIDTISEPGSITADARVIDATGLYVSPGFIDMHAHSDLYLLSHPDHAPKITQGVTVSPLSYFR
jgi:N-acyl-D-aspartate/D-glutamate deacylase